MAVLLAAAIVILGLDQVTKSVVLAHLRDGQAISFRWVVIRRVMGQHLNWVFVRRRTALVALWAVEAAVMLALVHIEPFSQETDAKVALGVAFGGASGNLFDRLCRGGVVDFVDVGFWPVFNLADAAIVVGAVSAVLLMR